ncbi:MAG: Fis family transcriptional regulator, partial [Desulfobulbaceae bacterium]|nr:Fis family transcriptional regulator [Desulfobulbaceae bacterium]
IEHAFILCQDGNIQQKHLPATFISPPLPSTEHNTLDNILNSAETQAIWDALKHNNYNRLATARELGLHKTTLFRKINKLGIMLPEIDGRSSR